MKEARYRARKLAAKEAWMGKGMVNGPMRKKKRVAGLKIKGEERGERQRQKREKTGKCQGSVREKRVLKDRPERRTQHSPRTGSFHMYHRQVSTRMPSSIEKDLKSPLKMTAPFAVVHAGKVLASRR